jgi:hypothetical protein
VPQKLSHSIYFNSSFEDLAQCRINKIPCSYNCGQRNFRFKTAESTLGAIFSLSHAIVSLFPYSQNRMALKEGRNQGRKKGRKVYSRASTSRTEGDGVACSAAGVCGVDSIKGIGPSHGASALEVLRVRSWRTSAWCVVVTLAAILWLIKCITSTFASYHNAIVGNLNIIIKKTPQEEDDVAIRSYNRRTQPPSTKPWLTCAHMRNHQFHSNSA